MNRLLTSLFVPAAIAFGPCAAPAQIVFDHHIYGMPDFDQRRADLGGNGAAYCAPTGAINMMAYISNHGYPAIMDGPRTWQLQEHADDVSFQINVMGIAMDTDSEAGTTTEWQEGLISYMNLEAAGKFTVTQRYVTPEWNLVTPFWMFTHLYGNSLVCFCYGRYAQLEDNSWERQPGHVVTVNGIEDANEALAFVLYRNPGTDSDLTSQSIFATTGYAVIADTITVGDTDLNMWEMQTNSADGRRRFIDGYVTVDTTFVLTPTVTGSMLQLKPFQLTGGSPPILEVNGPVSGRITSIAIDPDQTKVYLTTTPTGTSSVPRLWRWTKYDGAFTPLLTLPSASVPLAMSRQGDLYIVNGGAIQRYNVNGAGAVLTGSHTPAAPPSDIAYDDSRDELVALLPNRHLLRYPRALTTPIDRLIPSSLALTGQFSLATGAERFNGKYLVSGATHRFIHMLSLATDGTNNIVHDESLTIGSNYQPQDVKVSDIGTLFVINGGQIDEIEFDRTAGWRLRPGSDFTGLRAGTSLDLSRSRNNFDPAFHTMPAWSHTVD